MWARLHDDGSIEVFAHAREIRMEGRDYGADIFRVWPPEDLARILNIVSAAYADAAPSPHHVAVAEHAVSHGDHVTVTRSWEDRGPKTMEPVQGISIVDNSTTITQTASLEMPLMQREADALLRVSASNAGATFATSDYVLLATLIGRAVPKTGSETVDLKAAAVHVHHELRRLSESLAQSILQREAAP